MKQQKSRVITEEELQAAIRKFIRDGGQIQVLPEQKAVANRHVGRKWDTSELSSNIDSST